MKRPREIGFMIFAYWIIEALSNKETIRNYLDSEPVIYEYFQLNNGKPLHLNETDYCLEEISATILPSALYGNRNTNFYLIEIRWISKSFMMSIKLESNSLNDSYCEAENKHYYNRKPLNQSIHVFPDDVNEGIRFLPIKLDCKYTITPELEGMCRPIKLEYETPVCIDNMTCTCRNVFLPTPVLQAILEKNGVVVLWSFPDNSDFNVVSKVVILIYHEDGINIKKIAKRKIIIETLNWSEGNIKRREYFQINYTNENNYRIQSFFENRINCHGNSSFLRFRHFRAQEHASHQSIVQPMIFFAIIVVFLLATLLFFWKKQFRKICRKLFRSRSSETTNVEFYPETYNHKSFLLPPMICNSSYSDPSNDSYWFDYRDLVFLKEIGYGNFGVVFLATSSKNLNGTNEFAVKQLKDKAGPDDLSDFVEEINMFKLVGSHPNIVKMFGYCGAPHPPSIIMEYVPFNLLKYLKNLRIEFEKRKLENTVSYAELCHFRSSSSADNAYITQSEIESNPVEDSAEVHGPRKKELEYVLDSLDLETFGLQIARGMSYLESRAIVHRDLAARNVLMDAFKNLKISDFGMSRKGIYVNKTTKKFPLRWMSPEALINRTHSNKSDVWSFGVVLWEIGTLGAFPYSSLQNEEVIQFLKKGGHLEKPQNVTDHLYDVMMECWAYSPEERPTFGELVQKLEEFRSVDYGYVDFNSLNLNYVFPPMEEELESKKSTEKE